MFVQSVPQVCESATAQVAVQDIHAPDATLPGPVPSSVPQSAGALLIRILRDPSRLSGLSVRSWGELIPQAKFAGLWPQIAATVKRLGIIAEVPHPVHRHLQSAQFAASAHESMMRWEVDRLQVALAEAPCPIILLKGSAFIFRGFRFAQGRYFQDVDILVPKGQLATVEAALHQHGWVVSERRRLHASYFRTWLQELPPMWHHERKVQLDIHYTIVPPKDRIVLDPTLLYESAVPIGDGSLRVLAPADMFLHAASNLFRTGEFTYLLRDLYDMNAMLAELSAAPGFWNLLLYRAARLNLKRPCFYAMRYLREIFETPVPAEVLRTVSAWGPSSISLRFVDALVHRTLFPKSLDAVDAMRNFALTVREYWPPPRLRTIFSSLFWLKRFPGRFHEALAQRITTAGNDGV